jgi:hypothetical protein
MCLRLMSRGVDVGLMTTPCRLARTLRGSYSSEYFISTSVFGTIANFRQLVSEIRVLIQLMRERYRYIGLLGMSSGGFQTGLAALCEEVDFLFPLITGCHLGSITWQGLITRPVRRDLEQRGINEAAPNRVWSITDLAVVGKHTKARKIKQYIALYDTVVLIRYQEELWAVYVDLGVLTCLAGTTARIFNLRSVMDDIAGVIQKETSRAGTLPACVPVWRRSVVRDFGPPGTASRLRDRFFRQ